MCTYEYCNVHLLVIYTPLVSGLIQLAVQLIFKGHPLNTLEKQAPICKAIHICLCFPV